MSKGKGNIGTKHAYSMLTCHWLHTQLLQAHSTLATVTSQESSSNKFTIIKYNQNPNILV